MHDALARVLRPNTSLARSHCELTVLLLGASCLQRITPSSVREFVNQLYGQFGSGSRLRTARGAANTAVRLIHTVARGAVLWRTLHKQVLELEASCLVRVDNSRSGRDFVLPLITFELKVRVGGEARSTARHSHVGVVHVRPSSLRPTARRCPASSCA